MRKLFFIFIFLSVNSYLFAAAFFWIGGGANTNWNTIGNWSGTSGGASNGATPSGTSDVTFDGAGAGGNGNSVISANVTILSLTFTTGYTATVTENSTVVLTVNGNFTDQTQHSWTINSAASGALSIGAASTITSNGKTFPGNVLLNNANTKALSGDWTITGTLSTAATGVLNTGTLTCSGFAPGGSISGSTLIKIVAGTWSGNFIVLNSITIAGNVTVSGSVSIGNGCVLTYSSGTVTTTSSTLIITNSATLNTSGITWNNINHSTNAQTVTNNSLLTATGTMTISDVQVTWAGTSAWTVGTFTCNSTTSSKNITLVHGLTYTITTALNAFTSRTGSIVLFTSDHATLTAALTLQSGATCSVLADFTRIDASGGRTINTFHGTLTSTTNVFSYTDYNGGGSSSHLFVQ